MTLSFFPINVLDNLILDVCLKNIHILSKNCPQSRFTFLMSDPATFPPGTIPTYPDPPRLTWSQLTKVLDGFYKLHTMAGFPIEPRF